MTVTLALPTAAPPMTANPSAAGAANSIAPFTRGATAPTPANGIAPFTRSAPTPANSIQPFTRGNAAPPTPVNNWSFTKGKGIPSAAKPLPLAGAAPASVAGGSVAGVVGVGGVIGVGGGELLRRDLVRKGFDGFAYPSNTKQQLLDPVGTVKGAIGQYAKDYQEWFNPAQTPQVHPTDGPGFLETTGEIPFSGGQSPGVSYRVTGLSSSNYFPDPQPSNPVEITKFVIGPVGLQKTRTESQVAYSTGTYTTAQEYIYLTSAGQPVHLVANGSESPQFINGEYQGQRGRKPVFTITSIQRTDGQPDTGGDPAPELEPLTKTAGVTAPAIAPPIPLALPALAPSPAPLKAPSRAPSTTPGTSPARAPSTTPSIAPGAPAPSTPPYQQPSTTPGTAPGTSPGTAPGTSPGTSPGTTGTPSKTPGKRDPWRDKRRIGNRYPSSKPSGSPQTQPQTSPQSRFKASAPGFGCSPCFSTGGQKPPKPDEDGCTLDEVCEKLDKISETVGVKEFPATLKLLTGDRSEQVKNLPELVLYVVKNLDAVSGKWPLETQMLGADGKQKNLKLEDMAHAYAEIFAALKVVAEDADASVNALVRVAAELVSTKVSVLQGNEIARANKKFLGYQSARQERKVKLQFSPKIAGADGRVDNYEMKQFFTPSTQSYIGYECVDKRDLMGIALRTLEDGEIARAATFKPLVKDKKGESSLTGDHIRKTREDEKKKQDKEWKDFQGMLKKQGAKYRINKGVKKRNNGFNTDSRKP